MKKISTETNVLRLGISAYFDPNFIQQEKCKLESIENVKYINFDSNISPEVIISNTHQPFTNEISNQLKNTKLIIHSNSGYDNFNAQFVESFEGHIVIGNEIRQHAVANFIISAIFQHYTSFDRHLTWDQTRIWPRKLLSEIKIQLIGFGHIGNILKNALSPLVKNIFIYDPYLNLFELEIEKADVIIPVCSLNNNNQNLINKDFLNKLKKDVLIINAARGELINIKNLIDFLNDHSQALAILDVFSPEPYPLENLKSIANLKTTSHIAGVYKNIDKATIEFEYKIINDFLNLSNLEFTEKYKTAILKHRLINNILI